MVEKRLPGEVITDVFEEEGKSHWGGEMPGEERQLMKIRAAQHGLGYKVSKIMGIADFIFSRTKLHKR